MTENNAKRLNDIKDALEANPKGKDFLDVLKEEKVEIRFLKDDEIYTIIEPKNIGIMLPNITLKNQNGKMELLLDPTVSNEKILNSFSRDDYTNSSLAALNVYRIKKENIINQLSSNQDMKTWTFDKKDLLWNNDKKDLGIEQPSTLNDILRQPALAVKLVDYLADKNQDLTMEDLTKGPCSEDTPISTMFETKTFFMYLEKLQKNGLEPITRDLLFNDKNNIGSVIIENALKHNKIEELNNELKKNGETFKKDDFFNETHRNPPYFFYASEQMPVVEPDAQNVLQVTKYNITAIQNILTANNETLTPEDLFNDKYGKTPYQNAVKWGFSIPLEWLENGTITFKKEHLVNEDGIEKNVYKHLLGDVASLYMFKMMVEENIPIAKNDVVNDCNSLGSPLGKALKYNCFDFIKTVADKNNFHFKKEDFLPEQGLFKEPVILNAKRKMMSDINKYLKEKGEKTINISDLAESKYVTKSNLVFKALLNIPNFSDKPEDIKAFWNKLPENKKTEDFQRIYKNALQKAITEKISFVEKIPEKQR